MTRGSLSRTILVLGGLLFGAFAVVALVMSQSGASDQAIQIVAGVMAYLFIVLVAVAWFLDRRRRARPDAAAAAFLKAHPSVGRAVGVPMAVLPAAPGSTPAPAKGPGQATVLMVCRGPRAEAHADVVLARLRGRWEVLSAELIVDGDRVPLSGTTS